jgi:ClpX C4-type zinc finger
MAIRIQSSPPQVVQARRIDARTMDDPPNSFCAFCNRPQTEVEVLVGAPGGSAAICDDCAKTAVDIVQLVKADRARAEEAAWLEREADPDWRKGLHNFRES